MAYQLLIWGFGSVVVHVVVGIIISKTLSDDQRNFLELNMDKELKESMTFSQSILSIVFMLSAVGFMLVLTLGAILAVSGMFDYFVKSI